MLEYADGVSRAVEDKCGTNGLVPWYLMAGLMYYHFDNPILTDARFDEIAKTLLAAWDDIEHNHKHFITKEDLEAGTLSLKIEEFPMMTRGAANAILTSLKRSLTPEQYGSLFFADFIPPKQIRDNPELYTYHLQGERKKSWTEVEQERAAKLAAAAEPEEAPVPVRTRQRPSPASPVAQEPLPAVRTRVRPVLPPADEPIPEVRVRVRVPNLVKAEEPVAQVRTRTRPQ
ncbi:hypothetical protein EVC24_035 [Rhizobium phage RHph_I4]|nr:hypothetical protein EVC24_035 [Rhizobium phage RHph_I4]